MGRRASPRPSVQSLAQELVRIPSQGGIDPAGRICLAVGRALAERGYAPELLTGEDGAPVGVVVLLKGGRPGPVYALNAVIDTAPVGDAAAWSVDPFGGTVAQGKLYGRGAADSKIAAAMFIGLAQELLPRREAMAGSLVFFFDAAEHTGRFEGIRAFLKRFPKIDGMAIGYPGNDALRIGSRGFLRSRSDFALDRPGHAGDLAGVLTALTAQAPQVPADPGFPLPPRLTVTELRSTGHAPAPSAPRLGAIVTLHGTAAHSGARQEAPSAVTAAAGFLAALGEAAQVLSIQGGTGFSQVPDRVDLQLASNGLSAEAFAAALARAAADLPATAAPVIGPALPLAADAPGALSALSLASDIRTVPGFDTAAARAHRTAAFSAAPAVLVAEREEEPWPPFVLPPDNPLRRALATAIAAQTGASLPETVSGPSNVGNLLAAHGIPTTTGFGPAASGAHGADEHIDLATVPAAYAVYRHAVERLMDLPPASAPRRKPAVAVSAP